MSSKENDLAAPLYITVGPPCAGKTTWLRQFDTLDITLDDQEGVYRPLPARYFVDEEVSVDDVLKEVVVEKTLHQRLMAPDQEELRAVCRFVCGNISAKDLGEQLTDIHSKARLPPQTKIAFTKAVSKIVQEFSERELPATVDLFCREVLFSKVNDNTTAIDRAYHSFRSAPLSRSVAWGNTNLRFRDYEQALQIAAEQRRPVKFCVFDSLRTSSDLNNEEATTGTASNQKDNGDGLSFVPEAFDLKADSYQDLMRRNVKRLLDSGRYIPSIVIWDMLQRSRESLWNIAGQRVNLTRDDLQQQLARACRFDLLNDGTVRPLRKRPAPEHYQAVDQRRRERYHVGGRNGRQWGDRRDQRRDGFRPGHVVGRGRGPPPHRCEEGGPSHHGASSRRSNENGLKSGNTGRGRQQDRPAR